MPRADDGYVPSEFARPPAYETVFDEFKKTAVENPEWTAEAVARAVADALTTSLQAVAFACAVVHAMHAARRNFALNEGPAECPYNRTAQVDGGPCMCMVCGGVL